MALSNNQYAKIMHDYEERQNATRLLRDERLNEIIQKIPEYKILEDEAINASMKYARSALLDNAELSDQSLDELRAKIDLISRQKVLLLEKNGYPGNYLNPVYTCPDCRDTGYIGSTKCHCFKQAIVDLLYSQSNIKEILKQENFKHFSLDLFDRNDIDPISNVSSYDLMADALKKAKEFVRKFPDSHQNLFFSGKAGLGKTFLTHCIADELLKRGFTVLYLSAPELFDVLRKEIVSKKDEQNSTELGRYVFNCDLLIIDDLGSETTTEFTVSELNTCINERLLGGHSTIISSNLDPNEIRETYGERNFSRIAGLYTFCRFYGTDLRLLKKYTAV